VRGYLGEIVANRRPLFAAMLGVGTGMGFLTYVNSIFAPYLLDEFGWSRAQFALIGLSMFSTIVVLPLVGRLTDRVGVRPPAIVGTLAIPLLLVAYSLQGGDFKYYLMLASLMLAAGALTSPVVYTRLLAERFVRAQGIALTIVTSAPAIMGGLLAQPITHFNDRFGWRMGFLVLALFVFLVNVLAVCLIPAQVANPASRQAADRSSNTSEMRFSEIFRMRTFWVLITGFMLCMLPTTLTSTQLSLVLLDQGLSRIEVGAMVSLFAGGTIAGRILCGLALDRFPVRLVTLVSMVIPAFGFFLLASPLDAQWAVAIAIVSIAGTVGAESDLMSYLVSRYFPLEVFSSTLGLLFCAVFFASGLGAVLTSYTLSLGGGLNPFLYAVCLPVAVGSGLFLMLPNLPPPVRKEELGDTKVLTA